MARRDRVVPNDEQAEQALLGAILLRPSLIEDVVHVVIPTDFYKPSHQILYSVLCDMWGSGSKSIDVVTICDRLKAAGLLEQAGGAARLTSLMSGAPGTSPGQVKNWSGIIVKMSTYRRAITIATDLAAAAYEQSQDPNDLIDFARAEFDAVGIHLGEMPHDTWQLDEYLQRPISDRPQWCIEGLIREGWRVMIVAGEGVGKTVLLRQIAIAAAQGIHPLDFSAIEPCRTLIVDLENPDDSVMDVCTPINERTKQRVGSAFDADRAWLWHRPSGINLRSRPDRLAFETIIATVQPSLVCLGPLYKAYEVGAHENDELAAREIMHVLDDLRTRYSFGLMMEHHAPKESGGSARKLMPYGSSLWLRWPEIGLNLHPSDETNERLVLGRWRGDRLDNNWPVAITRGGQWEWTGQWGDGHFDNTPPRLREPVSEPVTGSILPRPGGGSSRLPKNHIDDPLEDEVF